MGCVEPGRVLRIDWMGVDELAHREGRMSRLRRLPGRRDALPLGWRRPQRLDRRTRGGESRAAPSLAGQVSLLAMALSSGSTIELAIELLARQIDGSSSDPWRSVLARLQQGADLHSALAAAEDDLSPEVRRVFRTLDRAATDGVALAGQLRSLAADLHARRITEIEASGQRLSVTLLFPLVMCVLPAFALLTLAPLVIGIFEGIRF